MLQVHDLKTWFATSRGPLKAVDGVSLQLERGQALGLVGESGSGKSVLIRSIAGFDLGGNVSLSEGRSIFEGADILALSPKRRRRFWGRHIAFVFQNPMTSLNPVVKIGRQVTEVIEMLFDADSADAEVRAVELLASVGISDPEKRMHSYPHELSGGMRQRVTIAIALAGEPELLIADEPTTALDVTVQAQILSLLRRLQLERNMGLVLVSHNLAVVSGVADHIAVMYAGKLVEYGEARSVLNQAKMPYTEALLKCNPDIESESHTRLATIPGRPPDLVSGVPGCSFNPRCRYVRERCLVEEPPLAAERGSQSYACWYPVDQNTPTRDFEGVL